MAKKILVVDDEKDYSAIVMQALTKAGYEVVTASNGKEGLEKVRDESPDMLVLDISMPVMDGYEVCKEIRKDAMYKNIPIIFLTVLSSKQEKLKGLNTGSDEYLTKPFQPKELVLRVKKLLS